MPETQPSNQELSLAAGVFTVFLCIIFGSNIVAIKLAFSGMGVFTTASIRFAIAASVIFLWARFTGPDHCVEKRTDSSGIGLFHAFYSPVIIVLSGPQQIQCLPRDLAGKSCSFFYFVPGSFLHPRRSNHQTEIFWHPVGICRRVVHVFGKDRGYCRFSHGGFNHFAGRHYLVLFRDLFKTNYQHLHPFSGGVVFNPVFGSNLFSRSPAVGRHHGYPTGCTGHRIFALPEPDHGIFWFCRLEYHAPKIRDSIIAFVCIYHAHCRGSLGGTGFRRADYSQDFVGPCFYRVWNFSGSLAPQKGSAGISDPAGHLIGHPG